MTKPSVPDISAITEYLYVSAWPEGEHTDEIVGLNIRLILSMHWIRPSRLLHHPPLRVMWLPTIDTPFTPMPIETLRRGVDAALPTIRDGRAVLCHCRAGVHRSVAMASCVLIGLGHSAEEAMHMVKKGRVVADPYAGYIKSRILKFEEHWHAVSQ